MSNYNKIYKSNKSVWGSKVNPIIGKALKFFKTKQGLKALDLGCGQGKEAFFLAKKGFDVTAIDSSSAAIKQIKEKTKNYKLPIKSICRDVANYKIKKGGYDIIAAMNVLQFLEKKEVMNLINNVKAGLRNNGLAVLSAFTTKDASRQSKKKLRYYFKQGEMRYCFKDFKILYYSEKIISDSGHPSMPWPHQHGIVEIIVCKI
jgi:cyclopropane fatty-acyl-phospholipid synthase-like methyltransferase